MDTTDVIVRSATGLITAAALWFTIHSWNNVSRVKRAEFLEVLIKSFNDSSTFLARRILDDFWILTKDIQPEINIIYPKVKKKEISEMTDQELITYGSMIPINKGELQKRIDNLFRDHITKNAPVTCPIEQRARQSFDDLLDFYTKLEYYLNLELISTNELTYFHYYLSQYAKKDSGLKYVLRYGYRTIPRLMHVMNIISLKDDNQKFDSEKQVERYNKLRGEYIKQVNIPVANRPNKSFISFLYKPIVYKF